MGRWLAPAAFGLLVVASGAGAVDSVADALENPNARMLGVAGYALLRTAVVMAFACFVVVRDEARRPSREPVAFLACAVAVVAVVALEGPPASATTPLVLAGELVTVLAGVWLLVSVLALGRCFGVLPEARGLVARGPYRVVRHPVYLGELGACAGLLVAAPTARNAAVTAAFVAAQLVRTRLEERALTAAFPEYERYAATTPRLVPRLGLARTAEDSP